MTCLSSLFNLIKTIQVTAYLLKQNENKMRHLRLLKLLYLINREALKEDANFVIYDTAYASPKGLILSTVYKLIEGRGRQSNQWQRYIETGQYHVFLGNDPGDDELSKFEKNIIESVFNRYGRLSNIELIEFMETLPEWNRYVPRLMLAKSKNSYHIELKEIVNAVAEETGKDSVAFLERVKRNVVEVKFFADVEMVDSPKPILITFDDGFKVSPEVMSKIKELIEEQRIQE